MIKRSSRTALLSTMLLAAIIVTCAAADPGGLFAIVAWTGGKPVAAWWWWAPYVVFTPLLLILNYLAVRSLALNADANTPRSWLFFRIWLLQIPVTACAWLINALLVLYGSMAGKTYLMTFSDTFAFLFWSGGYATLKLACLGWLPALVGLLRVQRAMPDRPPAADSDALATVSAGVSMALLALAGPWMAAHWWQHSPLGYIYREIPGMPTPTPSSGPVLATLALLLFGVVVRLHARRSFARLGADSSRHLGAIFISGVLAGVMAALVLLLVQIIALLAHGIGNGGTDVWSLAALILVAVEACSIALLMAACSGFAALAAVTLLGRSESAATNADNRYPIQGLLAAGSAIVISAILAWASPDATTLLARNVIKSPNLTGFQHDPIPLQVRHDSDRAILANQQGAQIMLRGVNVNQLGEYWQADTNLAAAQPLTRSDFVDMAALGINSVRLTLSWARLEPQRGFFSEAYLEQIAQAVSWAAENHIYVMLDMHQDAWGTEVAAQKGVVCRSGTDPMKGWDGAPGWATLTDSAPACQFTGRDLAPNVSRAFQSFYFDRNDIQTELVHAWAILAGKFADNSTVIGYDLLNEPNFAETPTVTSTLLLANYYARAIDAIRKAESTADYGYTHPVVIEPSIFWSGFGLDNLPPASFTSDSQLVYSPHLYNESITSDQDLGVNLISIERGLRLAQHAATQLGAALWIGEWGFFGDSRQQAGLWQRQARAEEQAQTGSAIWVWKQGCGDPHVYPGPSAGNIVRADCPANQVVTTDAVVRQIVQRPYVQSAPGRVVHLVRNDKKFEFSGSAEVGSLPLCGLTVWVPGDAQPRLNVSVGLVNTEWQRINPGLPLLGASGGWELHACVSDRHYHAEIN